MRRTVRDWLGWENWVLLSLIIVSVPSLDGVWEHGGDSGLDRGVAAWWICIVCTGLIIQPVKTTFWQTASWIALGFGCLVYLSSSPVPYFWGTLAVGAFVQGVRTATGSRERARMGHRVQHRE